VLPFANAFRQNDEQTTRMVRSGRRQLYNRTQRMQSMSNARRVQVLGAPECKKKTERLELPRIDLILSTPAGGGTVPGMEKTSRHASKSPCTAAGSDLAGGDPAPRRGRRRLCRRRALSPSPRRPSPPVPARINAGLPLSWSLELSGIEGPAGFWTTTATKWVLEFLE
jgi:hypothetical protein